VKNESRNRLRQQIKNKK